MPDVTTSVFVAVLLPATESCDRLPLASDADAVTSPTVAPAASPAATVPATVNAAVPPLARISVGPVHLSVETEHVHEESAGVIDVTVKPDGAANVTTGRPTVSGPLLASVNGTDTVEPGVTVVDDVCDLFVVIARSLSNGVTVTVTQPALFPGTVSFVGDRDTVPHT
jgi:hypothetical protein